MSQSEYEVAQRKIDEPLRVQPRPVQTAIGDLKALRFGLPVVAPLSGNYARPAAANANPSTGTVSLTAGDMLLLPFVPYHDFKIDRMLVDIDTGGLKDFRFVLYTSKAGPEPARLLYESETVSGSSTGNQEVTLSPSIRLIRGRIYFAGLGVEDAAGAAPLATSIAAADMPASMGYDSSGGAFTVGWVAAVGGWDAPTEDPGPLTKGTPSEIPDIWLRRE